MPKERKEFKEYEEFKNAIVPARSLGARQSRFFLLVVHLRPKADSPELLNS
jgi:hypothetical protein